MVSNLKRFMSDPNKKGRGEGWYYHRGNGVWSKYSEMHDGKYVVPIRRIKNKVVLDRKERYSPHKGDYKGNKSAHRIGKSGIRGSF